MSYEEFRELRGHIAGVLDENLKKLDRSTGPEPVQKGNGPVKPQKTSTLSDRSTANTKKVP